MLKDALQWIVDRDPGSKEIVIDGQSFVTGEVQLPPEPVIETVSLRTLRGLAGFVEANIDHLELERHVVHVGGPDWVRLLGPTQGRHRRRDEVVLVDAIVPEVSIGSYLDLEEMTVALQSCFVPTPGRDQLLAMLSRVRAQSDVQTTDDGLSQRIAVASGIELLEEARIQNPVELAPYRIFPEVEQPLSEFLVRLRQGSDGEPPRVALFEADGGAWRLRAVHAVAEHLDELLDVDGLQVIV